jgi:hypothetical protein
MTAVGTDLRPRVTPGVRVIVESERLARPPRRGSVERILSAMRYEVRWDDGRTSVITPASGALRMDNDDVLQLQTCVLFRAWNDQILDLEKAEATEHDFVCECSDEACTRVMPMGDAVYDALRVDALTFAVVPGHEEGSEVLICAERYSVIRKKGAQATWAPPYVASTRDAPTFTNPAVKKRSTARRAWARLARALASFENRRALGARRRAEAGGP